LKEVRAAGIAAEMYPDQAKLKKQMDFANKRNIPYVLIIGAEEMQKNVVSLKNMQTGGQRNMDIQTLMRALL
jgi:histidyl-tRNA synthetase